MGNPKTATCGGRGEGGSAQAEDGTRPRDQGPRGRTRTRGQGKEGGQGTRTLPTTSCETSAPRRVTRTTRVGGKAAPAYKSKGMRTTTGPKNVTSNRPVSCDFRSGETDLSCQEPSVRRVSGRALWHRRRNRRRVPSVRPAPHPGVPSPDRRPPRDPPRPRPQRGHHCRPRRRNPYYSTPTRSRRAPRWRASRQAATLAQPRSRRRRRRPLLRSAYHLRKQPRCRSWPEPPRASLQGLPLCCPAHLRRHCHRSLWLLC